MAKKSRQQGELERAVLDVLWDSDQPMTSAEVLALVSKKSDLALTTILTVMSRLIEKELVERVPAEGRGYLFSPTSSREQHAASQLLKILENSENPALTLSHFASGLDKKSLAALRQSLK